MNDTKENVELHRHYEIFTVIWYFNVLSIFTPSVIHLRSCFPDRSKMVRYKHRENGYQTMEKMHVNTVHREVEMKNLLGFEECFDKWITIWEHEYNDNEKIYRVI